MSERLSGEDQIWTEKWRKGFIWTYLSCVWVRLTLKPGTSERMYFTGCKHVVPKGTEQFLLMFIHIKLIPFFKGQSSPVVLSHSLVLVSSSGCRNGSWKGLQTPFFLVVLEHSSEVRLRTFCRRNGNLSEHILIYSPRAEIGCSREVAKARGEEMRSSRGYRTPRFWRELNMVFNSVFNQLQGKAVVRKWS